MDQQAEKDKTERVTGLGRRTREEIAKWNQMTALRFQTGGRHQTSPASLRGEEEEEEEDMKQMPRKVYTRSAVNECCVFCFRDIGVHKAHNVEKLSTQEDT